MKDSLSKRVYKNLANTVSILGVAPLCLLFLKDGLQYLIPLIVYNNIMDDLDGVLAVKLHIGSKFGAILDNVCDGFSHTLFVMLIAVQYANIENGVDVASVAMVLFGTIAAMALLLRAVSRLDPDSATGTGSATNELVRHLLFVLLPAKSFDFNPVPLLIATFALHAVSMLAPFRMPYLIRSMAKTAKSVCLVNVALVVAWLVPNSLRAVTLAIAACFVATYLYSFGYGCREWLKHSRIESSE